MSHSTPEKTILLVEDEALIAMNEAVMLKEQGYDVITAYSARKAIDAADQNRIDLILMDIDLGKGAMDGTEAAGIILKNHDIPIVFLSSHTEAEIVDRTEKISSYGYIVKNSGEMVINASIKMAFKLFESNKRLSEQKKQLDTTLHSIGDGVIATDLNGDVTSMNPVAEELTGWSNGTALGKPLSQVFNIINSLSREKVGNPVDLVLEHGQIEGLGNHTVLISKTGEEYHIADSASPIKDKNGPISGVVLVFRDVTVEYRLQRQLEKNEEKYRTIFNSGNDAIIFQDFHTGAVLDVNQKTLELYEFQNRNEMIGSMVDAFSSGEPGYTMEEAARYLQKAAQGEPQIFEWRAKKKSREIFWVEVNLKVIDIEDQLRILAVVRDISDRKRAEQQKDILMKEINHRVKNNLVMISSLINLKDQALGDRIDISDLARQVDAIRIIHEKLSSSEDITGMSIKPYIEELLNSVFPSNFTNIQLTTAIEPISLHSRKVVPLGLIINEIATNALKYGFSDKKEGEFSVEFKKPPSHDHYVLTLSNTGKPFPKHIDIDKAETLGLSLISALVDQLQGTIELQREPHPMFRITFPQDN